jgi:hypothetical protein
VCERVRVRVRVRVLMRVRVRVRTRMRMRGCACVRVGARVRARAIVCVRVRACVYCKEPPEYVIYVYENLDICHINIVNSRGVFYTESYLYPFGLIELF